MKNRKEEETIRNLFYDDPKNKMGKLEIIAVILMSSTIFFTIIELVRYIFYEEIIDIPLKLYSFIFTVCMIFVTTSIIYFLHIYFSGKNNQRLKTQVDILQTIIDGIPNPVYYKDTCGVFRGCNDAFEKFTTLQRQDIINKTVSDIASQEYAERSSEMDLELLKNLGLQAYEEEYATLDGMIHKMIINKAAYNDMDGVAQGIVGVITDIDERIKMEEELKESEEKYKCIIELSSDLIAIHDYERIIYINEKGAKLIGADSVDEIIGTSLTNYMSSDEIAVHEKYLEQLEKGEGINLVENKYIRRDGSEIILEVSAEPFIFKGKKVVHVVGRDVSLRKKAEELDRKLKETIELEKLRNEFFANISHELRTPLNVILSAAQMEKILLENSSIGRESNGRLGKYNEVINQNGCRLIRLIDNLIDLTKIDSGYFQMNFRNCDFISLVEDITLSVADYIQSMGYELIFDTNVEEKIISCDPEKIERVVLNLLSNAVKFTEKSGKILVIVEDGTEEIVLRVRDTGIGIPEDKQNMVFEKFVQIDKSLSRHCEGSGIGLSIVKSIVELHEGNISINNEYKDGTEFIVKLPVKVLDDGGKHEEGCLIQNCNIEKIRMEFSDIYV